MSKFSRAIFLLVVVGIFSLGIIVVYEGMTLAFHTTSVALATAIIFLTLSFIASTILGNYYYNAFTRTYYLLSSIWIGFFTYAFLASLLFSLLVLISQTFVIAGPFLYSIAALVSLYGILHTRMLVTKNVSIILPNLPPAWKGRTAAWISDVHFGQIYGSGYARRIAEHIEKLAPDLIFVGGDLFDGTVAPDVREQIAPLKELRAPLGVYFVTGNHEEYGDLSRFLPAIESTGMRVLADELVDIDGLQIIGVDYRNTSKAEGFKKVLATLPLDRNRPSLLLKHAPEDLEVANAAGVTFQIAGHTHNGQIWPITYIADWVHHGFGYGLKRFKDMQIYISSGAGSWGPPMRVGTDSEVVLLRFG